jgi:glutaryl-CoA dehydrogenase
MSFSHKYAAFQWDDPLLLNSQLTEEERMVRDSAHAYCQERLAPRVLDAFRHEQTDATIFREMGELACWASPSRRLMAVPRSAT